MDEACPKCGADDGIAGKCAAMFVAQKAEIASLRAQIAEVRRDAGESVVLLGGERDYLRAELTANNELYSITQSDLAAASLQYDAATAVIERLEAAARQDAEAIAAKERERKFQNYRADSAEAGWAKDRELLKQDTEEIARLRGLLREAGNELSIYTTLCTTPIELVERIRAALACRPQGEVRVQAHGPFPGAPFSPKS